jgi:hypothetical protein
VDDIRRTVILCVYPMTTPTESSSPAALATLAALRTAIRSADAAAKNIRRSSIPTADDVVRFSEADADLLVRLAIDLARSVGAVVSAADLDDMVTVDTGAIDDPEIIAAERAAGWDARP